MKTKLIIEIGDFCWDDYKYAELISNNVLYDLDETEKTWSVEDHVEGLLLTFNSEFKNIVEEELKFREIGFKEVTE